MFKSILESQHPIFYKIIQNSFKNERVSHAYLLVGDVGSPLLETAKFLAQSLICKENLACQNCIDCLRIENMNYADLIFVDGSTESIKKNQISDIQTKFFKSAIESSGIKIYIINIIENSRPDTFNAILKFLEEPASDVFAILTTNNLANILPTIVSRCEVLRLSPIKIDQIIQDSIAEGVDEKYARVLANIFNNTGAIKKYSIDSKFNLYYQYIGDYFQKILKLDDIHFFMMTVVVKDIENKSDLNLFLDLLELAYKDILKIQNGNQEIVYLEYFQIFNDISSKILAINDKIKEILLTKKYIDLNTSPTLLLDRLNYLILR